MRFSDCVRLITVPIYIQGHVLKAIPYLYLGRKVEHSVSQHKNTLTFRFNQETIVLESLKEYFSRNYQIRKISGPNKVFGSHTLVELSFKFGSSEDPETILRSIGYSGHAYDLPISWLNYNLNHKGIIEQAHKIFFKLLRKIELRSSSYPVNMDLGAPESSFFEIGDNEGNDVEDDCLLETSFQREKTSSCLYFFSDSKNKEFFDSAASKITTFPSLSTTDSLKNELKNTTNTMITTTKQQQQESKEEIKNENHILLEQFLKNKISFEMFIVLEAEQKKEEFRTIRSGSGKSSKASLSFSSEGANDEEEISTSWEAKESAKIQEMREVREQLQEQLDAGGLNPEEAESIRKRAKKLKRAERKRMYRMKISQRKKLKGQVGQKILSHDRLE